LRIFFSITEEFPLNEHLAVDGFLSSSLQNCWIFDSLQASSTCDDERASEKLCNAETQPTLITLMLANESLLAAKAFSQPLGGKMEIYYQLCEGNNDRCAININM